MYFPEPYPDELLGSLFIRASHHLGLAPWALLTSLSNGRNGEPSFIYPSLVNEVARLTGLSPGQLLWRHTIFPYVSIALDSARRDILETQLLDSTAPGSSLRAGSTFPPQVEALSFRRFCEVCRQCDITTRGESYWHRAHALPGYWSAPSMGHHCMSQAYRDASKTIRARYTRRKGVYLSDSAFLYTTTKGCLRQDTN